MGVGSAANSTVADPPTRTSVSEASFSGTRLTFSSADSVDRFSLVDEGVCSTSEGSDSRTTEGPSGAQATLINMASINDHQM